MLRRVYKALCRVRNAMYQDNCVRRRGWRRKVTIGEEKETLKKSFTLIWIPTKLQEAIPPASDTTAKILGHSYRQHSRTSQSRLEPQKEEGHTPQRRTGSNVSLSADGGNGGHARKRTSDNHERERVQNLSRVKSLSDFM